MQASFLASLAAASVRTQLSDGGTCDALPCRDEDLGYYRAVLHQEVLGLPPSAVDLAPGPGRPPPAWEPPPAHAVAELLAGGDTHAAVEALLGMRIFLGGVSALEYEIWKDQQGVVGTAGPEDAVL